VTAAHEAGADPECPALRGKCHPILRTERQEEKFVEFEEAVAVAEVGPKDAMPEEQRFQTRTIVLACQMTGTAAG
jgi:hypothetical protein